MPPIILSQQPLISPLTNPTQILSKLAIFDGVIWLNDQQNPVIGLCPRQLVQCRTSGVYHQQRQATGQLSPAQPSSMDFAQTAKHLWQVEQSNRWQSIKCQGFHGGLMGFIGYDWAAEHHLQTTPVFSPNATSIDPITASLGYYDIFFRLEAQGWQLYGNDCPSLAPLYQRIAHALNQPSPTYTLQSDRPFDPRWTRADYQAAFMQVQQYLRAGDCYQVNLTQPFECRVAGSLLAALDPLQHLTQAPYAGYLRLNAAQEILSCSPELFVEFAAHRQVITRPIKGTQPRYSDPIQDEQSKQALVTSEKDQAENLMIVDLLRNDLAKYAQIGSVHVPQLFEVESFAQVHHLVSEIHATLAADQSPLDLLLDALPGGSITGAPKIRAMQIIAELEAGRRGAYCGSMGYLNMDGTGRFNILIRTLERIGEQLTAWAGGGITIASDPDQEYQECLDKIGAILACVDQIAATQG
ncbi:MAG: aminodeoxychorismate synthase component I [Pseudomonadota bacterium]|nr:aminodeoxychorismate synthase component I [Pseudomonadota bacterium]